MKYIRNFSIIAHIDHGKSTLADRFIEICNKLEKEKLNLILDSMELEKEKGITIKSQCITLNYEFEGNIYTLNLIDTPGHMDFTYEVSRAISACEGAILLIDASQGIEAQTIANYNKAIAKNLKIITVLNKIDLIQADPNLIENEIRTILNIDTNEIPRISAKNGTGVKDLIETIIKTIPHPSGNLNNKLQALIIDSWFNNYLGIIALIKIENGILNKNDKIIIMSTNKIHKVIELGIFNLKKEYKDKLNTGEVGFIVTGSKDTENFPIGDTITLQANPSTLPLTSFQKIKPNIFAGIFTIEPDNFEFLKVALAKLRLNDSSLEYTIQNSNVFGFGFRCGFLGPLHMEIITERLEREYNLKTITTPPSVMFKITLKNGTIKYIDNPNQLPELNLISNILEPIADVNIVTPEKYLGSVIKLCISNRGVQNNIMYTSNQISVKYKIPINEIIFSFCNKLKTISQGFASMEYSFCEFKKADLIKLSILVNKKKIDALEFIIHRNDSYKKGKDIIEILKEIIPKHMFDVTIQAAIENKIIARAVIKALRKNVTAKCYGGDITRKKKLLKKQSLGKKRMKNTGNVEIPQKAFLAILDAGK
ncbi:MAG TPA: translation elongation factor 4 [Candidatus Azoamicus sp. OHIO1]